MRRRTLTATVLVLFLATTGVAAAAGDLSIGITQESSSVTIEVSRNGAPVSGANVTVASVGEESALDGDYVTNDEGDVVFDEATIANLSGVYHFRITVETEEVSKSRLATITRSPDVDRSAPLGQRISRSLQDSAARTRGTVEGTIFVTRLEDVNDTDSKIDVLRSHAEQTIDRLVDLRLEHQSLGRRHATGQLNLTEFFTAAIENSGERAMLRNDLRTTLDHLERYDVERLQRNGVDVESMRRIQQRLRSDRPLPAGATVSSGQ